MMSNIVDVVIPPSAKVLGEEAFCRCFNLERVTLSEGLREIGVCAFTCACLYSISIPSTVEKIGKYAFSLNQLLEVVEFKGSSLREIDEGAFFKADLRTISIPPFVKKIGSHTFMKCSRLTRVYLPEGLEEIGDYAFCKTGLTALKIPSTVRHIGLDALGIEPSTFTEVDGQRWWFRMY